MIKSKKLTTVYHDEYSENYDLCYDEPPAVDMELLKAYSVNNAVIGVALMDDTLFEIENMCHALGFDLAKLEKDKELMSIIETSLLLAESTKIVGRS